MFNYSDEVYISYVADSLLKELLGEILWWLQPKEKLYISLAFVNYSVPLTVVTLWNYV